MENDLPSNIFTCSAGVTESANLDYFILEEKGGRLEATMDVLFLREVEEASEYIFKVDEGFRLGDWSSSSDAVIKISLIAKLSDDVAVIDGAVYV